jgi:hypothetical protein
MQKFVVVNLSHFVLVERNTFIVWDVCCENANGNMPSHSTTRIETARSIERLFSETLN